MDQLRSKWADARRQFEDATSTASSVADTVRNHFALGLTGQNVTNRERGELLGGLVLIAVGIAAASGNR